MIRLLLIWLVFGLSTTALANDGIRYSGSSTVGTGVLAAGAMQDFIDKTGIPFSEFTQDGSSTGITALLAGDANVAGCSRALSPKEQGQGLFGSVIGYDAMGSTLNLRTLQKSL